MLKDKVSQIVDVQKAASVIVRHTTNEDCCKVSKTAIGFGYEEVVPFPKSHEYVTGNKT